MQWVVGQEYRTRDGRRARIYATDGYGERPVHGAVKGAKDGSHSGWLWCTWQANGRGGYDVSSTDLLPPRPPVEVSDAMAEAFLDAYGKCDGKYQEAIRAGIAAAIAKAEGR